VAAPPTIEQRLNLAAATAAAAAAAAAAAGAAADLAGAAGAAGAAAAAAAAAVCVACVPSGGPVLALGGSGALLVSAGHAGRVALWVVDSSAVGSGSGSGSGAISPLRELRSACGSIGALVRVGVRVRVRVRVKVRVRVRVRVRRAAHSSLAPNPSSSPYLTLT